MALRFLDNAVTPAVAAEQTRYYGQARRVAGAPERDALGEAEAAFIATRDSFYLGSVSETGWPYVQHRGGPPGFLRVLGPQALGFVDVRGNRQLLSTGNVAANDRVTLFLMDYPQRSRLKIMGHARVVPAREQPDLAAALTVPGQEGPVERLFLIDVVGFDWNCPKYITPRYTAAEVQELIAPLKERIAELETKLKNRN